MGRKIAIPAWVNQSLSAGLLADAEWWDEIASTNTRAVALAGELLLASSFHGPVLVGATRQLAGRGRGTNVWWSGAGALTISLIIRSADYGWQPSDDPAAAITTATAICRAAESVVPDAVLGIKWPNDVWCRGRKIGGLLVEPVPGSFGPGRLLVVGVGFNVNNRMTGTPVEATATSLGEAYSGGGDSGAIDMDRFGMAFLQAAIRAWKELACHRSQLAAEWRERCVLSGLRVGIQRGHERLTGRCEGPEASGGLVLVTESGRVCVRDGTVESFVRDLS